MTLEFLSEAPFRDGTFNGEADIFEEIGQI